MQGRRLLKAYYGMQLMHNYLCIEGTHENKSTKEVELTVKSSLAWAPLLSFLASAECMVTHALIRRFSNSIVSIKSEFLKIGETIITIKQKRKNKTKKQCQTADQLQKGWFRDKYHIKLLSFNLTSWKLSQALSINWQPKSDKNDLNIWWHWILVNQEH